MTDINEKYEEVLRAAFDSQKFDIREVRIQEPDDDKMREDFRDYRVIGDIVAPIGSDFEDAHRVIGSMELSINKVYEAGLDLFGPGFAFYPDGSVRFDGLIGSEIIAE